MKTGRRKYNRVENLGAAMCFILGCFIVNPYSDMFTLFPALYRPMRELYNNELFWGGLLMAVGGSALVLSYFGHWRMCGLVAGSGIMALAMLWGYADFHSPGWAMLGLLGFSCLAVYQGDA